MDTIGKRLEAERARLEMSQMDFARYIGLPQSTYNEYKSDKKRMSAEVFMNVCQALGWTPEYLFYGQGGKLNDARTYSEAELLRLFRSVPPEQHETVVGMIRVAIEGIHKANDAGA